VKNGASVIEDLGSTNGTQVGSVRIDGVAALRDGDEIAVGPAVLLFCSSGLGLTETERRRE
jgi:pSer/pThr/pTyr-binding forkhead associated (FHA) protein